MRMGTVTMVALMLWSQAYAQAKTFTVPQLQIISSGNLDNAAIQKLYADAYTKCMKDKTVASAQDYVACMKQALASHKLEVSLQP